MRLRAAVSCFHPLKGGPALLQQRFEPSDDPRCTIKIAICINKSNDAEAVPGTGGFRLGQEAA